jgi:hypothetical protein
MKPSLVVVGLLLIAPAVALAQGRGAGRSPQSQGAARGQAAWRGARDHADGRTRRGFESRGVFTPDASHVESVPFTLWFGYWNFYPDWVEEWTLADVVAAQVPLPRAPDGVPIGGLQLDVEPRRTQVYVDGFFAGVVGDFSGYYKHLDLPAGPHRIDLVETGYQPQTIGVVIAPGQTTTFRSTLSWTTSVQR